MTLTNEPQLDTEKPSPAPTRPTHRRSTLGWVVVVAAMATTTGLVIAVLDQDSARTERNLHFEVVDAKDHPGYGPVNPVAAERNLHVDVEDAKDHPGYGPVNPVAAERNLHVDTGDAKDHPRYNP